MPGAPVQGTPMQPYGQAYPQPYPQPYGQPAPYGAPAPQGYPQAGYAPPYSQQPGPPPQGYPQQPYPPQPYPPQAYPPQAYPQPGYAPPPPQYQPGPPVGARLRAALLAAPPLPYVVVSVVSATLCLLQPCLLNMLVLMNHRLKCVGRSQSGQDFCVRSEGEEVRHTGQALLWSNDTDICGGFGAAVVQQAPQRAGGGMGAPLLAGGVGLLAGVRPCPKRGLFGFRISCQSGQ